MIIALKPTKYSYHFLRSSIIQFIATYWIVYVILSARTYVFFGTIIIQYILNFFVKYVVWFVLNRVFPHRFPITPFLFSKCILLIDFYEAWKLDRTVNFINYYFMLVMYNITSLFYFVYAAIFLSESVHYSLNLIDVDNDELNKQLSFLVSLIAAVFSASNSWILIRYFSFNKGYDMSALRKLLAFIYTSANFMTQAYLVFSIIEKSIIAGVSYIAFRFLLYFSASRWIVNQNKYCLFRAAIPNQGNTQKQKDFVAKTLYLNLLFGVTVDIFPFYRSLTCIYDQMVSHYTFLILRIYQTAESCFAFYMLIYFTNLSLPSWLFWWIAVFISYSITVHLFQWLHLLLNKLIFPRKVTFSLGEFLIDGDDNNNSIKQSGVNIQGESFAVPFNKNQLTNVLERKNVQNNLLLELIEFINCEPITSSQTQRALDILLPYIWEDERLENSRILIDKLVFIQNRNEYTFLKLSQQNFLTVIHSLENSCQIRERDLTIHLQGEFTEKDIYSMKYVLALHIFEINQFKVECTSLLATQEKAKYIANWFYKLKLSRYSYQLQILVFFKFFSNYVLNNPKEIEYDLFVFE